MPGTRTAPTVDGSPSYKQVSLSLIDAVTDEVSNSLIADATATDAEVETYAAETQARSNASLYCVKVSDVYMGAKLSTNALSEVFLNAQDNIRYSVKESPTSRQFAYIPSPLESQLIAGTENPDTAALASWFGAVLAILKGNWAGLNVGFVEHKDRNQSIKF
jgi:hypothetical protein